MWCCNCQDTELTFEVPLLPELRGNIHTLNPPADTTNKHHSLGVSNGTCNFLAGLSSHCDVTECSHIEHGRDHSGTDQGGAGLVRGHGLGIISCGRNTLCCRLSAADVGTFCCGLCDIGASQKTHHTTPLRQSLHSYVIINWATICACGVSVCCSSRKYVACAVPLSTASTPFFTVSAGSSRSSVSCSSSSYIWSSCCRWTVLCDLGESTACTSVSTAVPILPEICAVYLPWPWQCCLLL